MAYPTNFTALGLSPGEVPKIRITYHCESVNDAMRKVDEAIAIHSNVDAHYDRETMVLTLEVS